MSDSHRSGRVLRLRVPTLPPVLLVAGLAVGPAVPCAPLADGATPRPPRPAAAGEPAAGDFEQLLRRVREHPILLALAAEADSARELATSRRALPDPEFVVGLNNFPLLDPSFDEYLPTNRSIGVIQSIPNGRGRRALAQADARSARVSELLAAQALDRLRARLLAALVERRRIAAQRALLTSRDARYQELAATVRAEIDAGRPVVFRLSRIDVERADVVTALAELDAAEAQAEAELVDLVGYPAVVEPPPLALTERTDATDAFHAVRIAEARTAVADAAVSRAESAYGPDFRVSLTWQQRAEGSGAPGAEFDGDDWVSASVGFTLPVWGRQRQAPQLRAARARRSASHSETLSAARASESRWSARVATVDAASRSIASLTSKLAALDEQIASLVTNYEAGIGDWSRVLDAQIARLAVQAQVVEEQARRDRTIALANALLVTTP